MLLSYIFDQLTHGEFFHLAIGGRENAQGINNSEYPTVISHVNLGLTALHKRFPIRSGTTIIQQYEQIGTYYLDEKFAVNSTSLEPIKYIIDSPSQPFVNNVLKIESVKDELGVKYALNNRNELASLYTPNYNSVQVPNPNGNLAMTVNYRADHDKIDLDLIDADSVEVNIPHSLLEALLYFIAARQHFGMIPIDGQPNYSAEFHSKYELELRKIEDNNLVNREEDPNIKLWCNEWP